MGAKKTPNNKGFTVRLVRSADEYAAGLEMARKVFEDEGHVFLPSKGHPGWRAEKSFVAVEGADPVGMATPVATSIAVGEESFDVVGVADVSVRADRRHRGIAGALLKKLLDADRQCDLSMLFAGPCPLYRQSGYEIVPRTLFILPPGCPDFIVPERYTVETPPLLKSLGEMREIARADADVYSGARDREAGYWEKIFRWYSTRRPTLFLARDRDGSPVAYAIAVTRNAGVDCFVPECRYRPDHPESPKNLLRAVLEHGRGIGATRVSALAPDAHPFGIKICLLGGRKEVDPSLMLRVLNHKSFASKTSSLLDARAELLPEPVRLDFEIDRNGDKRRFQWGEGKRQIRLKLSENAFLRMVLGAAGDSRALAGVSRDDRAVLDELFPRRNWIFWEPDYF